MYKKRIALFLGCLCALTSVGQAQDMYDNDLPCDGLPRHEFHINYGCPYLIMNAFITCCPDPYSYCDWLWDSDVHYRYADQHIVGTFTGGYLFRLQKWLWLGGEVGFSASYRNRYDVNTLLRNGRSSTLYISVLPMVRFSYLNRPHVHLYSGLSLGNMIILYSEHGTGESSDPEIYPFVSGHMTFFGVSFGGRNLRGTIETGWGIKGLLTVGLSYQFNKKNKQS